MSTIDFYDCKEKSYGIFSNYYPIEIKMPDGYTYASSEHYYQCMKFKDFPEYRDLVKAQSTANKSRELAQMKNTPNHRFAWRRDLNVLIEKAIKDGVHVRDDWDKVKDQVMYEVVKQKFTQHPALGAILLGTKDANIRENSPRDSYWGIGKDTQGLNKLGLTLMKVRGELQ